MIDIRDHGGSFGGGKEVESMSFPDETTFPANGYMNQYVYNGNSYFTRVLSGSYVGEIYDKNMNLIQEVNVPLAGVSGITKNYYTTHDRNSNAIDVYDLNGTFIVKISYSRIKNHSLNLIRVVDGEIQVIFYPKINTSIYVVDENGTLIGIYSIQRNDSNVYFMLNDKNNFVLTEYWNGLYYNILKIDKNMESTTLKRPDMGTVFALNTQYW